MTTERERAASEVTYAILGEFCVGMKVRMRDSPYTPGVVVGTCGGGTCIHVKLNGVTPRDRHLDLLDGFEAVSFGTGELEVLWQTTERPA